DQEPVRGRSRLHPERRPEGVALRCGQLWKVVEKRSAQLVDARIGKFHFRFDASRTDDAIPRRLRHQVVEQLALADPCFATHDHDMTRPAPRGHEQLVEPRALGAPIHKSAGTVSGRWHAISPGVPVAAFSAYAMCRVRGPKEGPGG